MGRVREVNIPTPALPKTQENRFVELMSGRAVTDDGVPFAFHSFKANDGKLVSTRFETHKLASDAHHAFAKSVESAIKVIEQGPRFNDVGVQVGERAVLATDPKNAGEVLFTIVGRKGVFVHYVESDTLQTALDFEKEFEFPSFSE